MKNMSKFLENKIKRSLVENGRLFQIYGTIKNGFHEKIDDGLKTEIVALYHETNSYQSKNVQDGSVTSKQPLPMLLCLIDEETKKIETGDYFIHCGKKYKVIEKNNIQDFDIAYDISLEVI